MTQYLGLKKLNCTNCHKCIRFCPVKAISYEAGQANVLPDECVLCGQCLVNCPQHAKAVRQDALDAEALLSAGAPVYVSLAPSYAAALPNVDLEALRAALTGLGFAGVEETAMGAAVVRREYERMVAENRQRVIISSCCHSVNLMVQKYFPEAMSALAKVVSPMLAHGAAIKRRNPGAKVVFIGPCISKKAEAESYPGAIDCVLTFEELTHLFESRGVALPQGEPVRTGRKSGLFPLAGGIVETMERPEGNGWEYLVIDGTDNCMAALKDVSEGKLERCFIEMSACTGSCINGPAMGKTAMPLQDALAVRRRVGEGEYEADQPDTKALAKPMIYISCRRPRPGNTAITETLSKMGKTKPEHMLNCGSCGYETCREKAEAILLGKAEFSMCLPYLMQKAKSLSDSIIHNTPNGIIVFDRTLEIRQINKAACHILNVEDENDVMGRQAVCILDPAPLMKGAVEGKGLHERRMWLAEYQRWVVMTAVLERDNDIIICILRDVTREETTRTRREELGQKAIEITDQVIEKHMRTVQEIASLLGETTADTQVALTHLKESLHHE